LKRRSAARAVGARNSPGRVQADGGGCRRPDSGAEGEVVLSNARHMGLGGAIGAATGSIGSRREPEVELTGWHPWWTAAARRSREETRWSLK
jgi:hypothetical protein